MTQISLDEGAVMISSLSLFVLELACQVTEFWLTTWREARIVLPVRDERLL
jgi:hypothetical protein